MKKLFYVAALTCLFFACKKDSDVEPDDKQNPSAQSNIVFFVDTFRVYTTDLEGNGLKAIIDEDEKSGNNFIGLIGYTQSKKLVYSYKTDAGQKSIKIANANGSGIKSLKIFTVNDQIEFVSGFGNKILYMTKNYSTDYMNPIVEIRSMDENGSNDTKLNLPQPSLAANSGAAYISTTYDYASTTPSFTFYVVRFENGTWSEAKSFTLPKNTAALKGAAISSDGNTLVYVTTPDYDSRNYDIYTVDISAKGNTSKKVASYTVPTTGEGGVSFPPSLSIGFANGTANVIVGYGVNVDKQRYATKNDYYFVQNIDVAKGTIIKKWKIFGEYGGSLLTN